MSSVEAVKAFWESNPLWTGESNFEPGSKEFFEEHRGVYIEDGFAGRFDPRFDPPIGSRGHILDLGCGPGFWSTEFSLRGVAEAITAVDLTENALYLARQRFQHFGVKAETAQGNAEKLQFDDGTFSHVNCQGVIHHTPDTQGCVREIARVLRPDGTACISVYYTNIVLRNWGLLRGIGKFMHRLGAGMKGRGREGIFAVDDTDEIVRYYDGADNPIGKSYTKKEYVEMLSPYFEVEEIYFHFFPARAFPFKIPKALHRILDKRLPFMIYANVRKK